MKPEWAPVGDAIHEVAANDPDPLLYKDIHAGNLERMQRGSCRATRFPEPVRAVVIAQRLFAEAFVASEGSALRRSRRGHTRRQERR